VFALANKCAGPPQVVQSFALSKKSPRWAGPFSRVHSGMVDLWGTVCDLVQREALKQTARFELDQDSG
jgi:hypothetical protein